MWSIEIEGGLKFEGLALSGETFITMGSVKREDLAGVLRNVKIECDDETEAQTEMVSPGVHEAMRLSGMIEWPERTGFTLRDVEAVKPASVEALRADVDYLLMMSEEA